MQNIGWATWRWWRNGSNVSYTESWNFPPGDIVVQTTLSRVVGDGPVTVGIIGFRRRLPSGADQYEHISDFYWDWGNTVWDPQLSGVVVGMNLGGNVAITALINLFYW